MRPEEKTDYLEPEAEEEKVEEEEGAEEAEEEVEVVGEAVEAVEEEPVFEPTVTGEWPIDHGGGWYELSNGDMVRGEERAVAAEEELR